MWIPTLINTSQSDGGSNGSGGGAISGSRVRRSVVTFPDGTNFREYRSLPVER